MPRTVAVLLLIGLMAGPVLAQVPDFGDDSSPFANDGECDDPRFAGPGMTATRLLDSDRRADATDCRAAFQAGRVTLAGTAAPGKAPPAAPPSVPPPLDVTFGDDTGAWPNDGECDDRRFTGRGMAQTLTWAQTGRDATDCRALADAGSLRRWVLADALAATACTAIAFGDDSGAFPVNGECDDRRFEGPGMASRITPDSISRDATDCRQLCTFGVIGLRDY